MFLLTTIYHLILQLFCQQAIVIIHLEPALCNIDTKLPALTVLVGFTTQTPWYICVAIAYRPEKTTLTQKPICILKSTDKFTMEINGKPVEAELMLPSGFVRLVVSLHNDQAFGFGNRLAADKP